MICSRCEREVEEIDKDGFCTICAEYAYRMKLREQARRRKQAPPEFSKPTGWPHRLLAKYFGSDVE